EESPRRCDLTSKYLPRMGSDVSDSLFSLDPGAVRGPGNGLAGQLRSHDAIHWKNELVACLFHQLHRHRDPVLLNKGLACRKAKCPKEGVRHGTTDQNSVDAGKNRPDQ